MSRAIKRTAEDVRWSLEIRKRDRYMCRRCSVHYLPNSNGLHAHHIFTRTRKATRHDLENGVALCYGCHMWAHRNPLDFHEWIEEQIGTATYDAVRLRSRRVRK